MPSTISPLRIEPNRKFETQDRRLMYKIALAREQDIPLLSAIELAAAQLLAGYAPERVLKEATSEQEMRYAQERGLLWVALSGDRPVGFAHVRLLEPNAAHLQEIDVHRTRLSRSGYEADYGSLRLGDESWTSCFDADDLSNSAVEHAILLTARIRTGCMRGTQPNNAFNTPGGGTSRSRPRSSGRDATPIICAVIITCSRDQPFSPKTIPQK